MNGYFDKREKEAKEGASKNHVDEYPPDLLFYLRTNDILHGLASRLGQL